MSFPTDLGVTLNPIVNVDQDLEMQVQKSSLQGRTVVQRPPSYGKTKNRGGGCGCCSLGILFLIAGGITLGICPKVDDQGGCTNATIRAGKILLITGSSLVGTSLCCVCALACILAKK